MVSTVSEALLVLQRWKTSLTDVYVSFVSSAADPSVRSHVIFSRLTGKVVLVDEETLNFIVLAANGSVFTAGVKDSQVDFGTYLDLTHHPLAELVGPPNKVEELLVIGHPSKAIILLFTLAAAAN